MRDKEFGIWQDVHLGPAVGARARRRPRPAGARRRRRRPGRRSTPRIARSGCARPGRRWPSAASPSVSIRPTRPPRSATRSPTPAPASIWPRTRSRSTRCSPSTRPTCPTCATSCTSSLAGVRSYDDPRLLFWDDFLAQGRAHREAYPGRRHPPDGRGRPVRRDDPRVHVGHHRAAEGGDAHQRQRLVLHRQHRRGRGPLPREPPHRTRAT